MKRGTAATVLVAPTAFKGTLGPMEAANAMAAGVVRVWPEVELLKRPLSDGGNGLLETYMALEGGVVERAEVAGPLGEPTTARFVRSRSTVVIESAEACGLHLVASESRDPLRASTRGVGELLLAALAAGASEVILGLGGSATVDGGSGLAQALGWRLVGAGGCPIADGGAGLGELLRIDEPQQRYPVPVQALCDVYNPLTGPQGAAAVYGPQKGAGPREVDRLEAGLARLAALIRTDLGIDVLGLAGAGAAGGLGAGARAFLGADLLAGAEWALEKSNIRRLMSQADLLVSGEGRFDAQSGMGKLTGKLLDIAGSERVPTLLVCGRVDGPVPAGVRAVDGRGRTLGYEDISQLTEGACRKLAEGDRL